ncbi:ATP-binding protein [Streptomyces beigongshangae]|uniref:ATP-binding protein n=1 Tax=Streptomyces beigongshangae TaxID=2841597 RepID=UPI0027DEEE47|nr:ATP-binding protein [Streptomyces sp. REN17]
MSGSSSCIAQARHHAASFLARVRTEQDVPVSASAVDLTQLVVSELVTNARVHAPGPARMDLRVADDTVEVSVQDSARTRPVARGVDPRRIGQHGLEIVQAIAQAVHVRLGPSGKRVSARIALSR